MIRSRKAIKKSLLHRAFKQKRGPQVIREIQKRMDKIAKWGQEDEKLLQHFALVNFGQPRAVMALNTLAHQEGSDTRFTDVRLSKAPRKLM